MSLINFLYPPRCFHCKKHLCHSVSLCFPCWKSISQFAKTCPKCKQQRTPHCCVSSKFSGFRCVAKYEGTLQKLLLDFKFSNKTHYAFLLGELLWRNIKRFPFPEKLDGIIPVPITQKRRLQRGYNQAELISGYLAKKMKCCHLNNYLVKIKNTKPQSQLEKKERLTNVSGAFHAKNFKNLELQNILLVDDIYTSGSTVRECVNELKKANCRKVYVAVIAT